MEAKGGVLVVDDLPVVAAPSERDAGGVSSTGKELIELFASEVQRVGPWGGAASVLHVCVVLVCCASVLCQSYVRWVMGLCASVLGSCVVFVLC
jgi:hypothetical protein